MVNRLKNYATDKNNPLRNKIDSIDDVGFLKSTGDTSKPANNKIILDDIEAIQKHNQVVDQIGAPQTNFAPNGNTLAYESSSTPNATAEAPDRKNPLFDFEPVNYLITLSAISKEAFNSGGGEGEEIIIAKSGGKGKQGPGVLGADYFIDNLVVRNTVSPTSEGKSGTVFNVMFDVTEPYGTSFVDSIITAAKSLGFENHLKAVFKLDIDFKGVDDNGSPSGAPIEGASRIIPIHIYAIDMRVEAGVTTYQVQARPATMLGTTVVHGIIQETLTVSGDTVGEVLEDFFNQHTLVLERLSAQNRITSTPDEYTFSIPESSADIINAKIPYDTNASRSNVIAVSNTATGGKLNFKRKRTITVSEGTAMQAFIEAVVRESDFYRKQFNADGEPIASGDTLTALRTCTRLNIINETGGGGGNRPQYGFIFVVRSYQVNANYFKKTGTDLASNVEPVREYNYLYTGKNQDILDFNVVYKFAFYQAIPYFKQGGKDDASTSTYSGEGVEENENEETAGATGSGNTQVTKEVIRTKKDGFVADLNVANGEVSTIFEQIIQDPSADLIVTQIEILGDPLWIEQKSVLNGSYANSFTEGSPCIDSNGAITTDEYEIYVQINFKTPTDLNDDTGLFNIQDAAFFQGKYKVYICESRFAGGVFTNVLQMVRMRHQQEDQSREQDSGDTVTNNAPGGVPVVPESTAKYDRPKFDINNVLDGSGNVRTKGENFESFEQSSTTNNVSFLRTQLNPTQQNSFDNLMSPTAQRDPLTAQGAYDYVLNNNVGVFSDPQKRLEERYGSRRLSPGALGGRQ